MRVVLFRLNLREFGVDVRCCGLSAVDLVEALYLEAGKVGVGFFVF